MKQTSSPMVSPNVKQAKINLLYTQLLLKFLKATHFPHSHPLVLKPHPQPQTVVLQEVTAATVLHMIAAAWLPWKRLQNSVEISGQNHFLQTTTTYQMIPWLQWWTQRFYFIPHFLESSCTQMVSTMDMKA